MDFAKGWGRIERLLLILAVIVSIFAIYKFAFTKSVADRQISDLVGGMLFWAPYLGARIIGWIVKGFIGKDDD